MNIIRDITTYAFRGSGKCMLIIGAILSVVSEIVSFAPTLGFMTVIGMFTLMANGRMLGIFYRKTEDRLDWI